MLFTTLNFLIFLSIVFVLYWTITERYRILLLLVSSNVFYAFWNFKFLILLNITILIDYICGKKIYQSEQSAKKMWLFFSIFSCLSILIVFKYLNFFINTFSTITGFSTKNFSILDNVILPVGISFYTFHGISYVIDIYRKDVIYEKKIVNYALFVSYFPLLVAGPIERSTNLLNQISKRIQNFDYFNAKLGLRMILIGFFKKIAIADNLGGFVDEAFNYHQMYNGFTLLLATFIFGFQIYFDFSAYTNIASGVSKLFGYDLILNFKFPYFASSPKDFWKRWHISLSSFFKDYVYIPLGGNQVTNQKFILNVLIVFLLSGLWHGANLTFLFWGLYHGLLIIGSKFIPTIKIKLFGSFGNIFKVLITYFLINISWIFFRSPDLETSWEIIIKIFNFNNLQTPYIKNGSIHFLPILLSILFLIVELYVSTQKHDDVSYVFAKINTRPFRWLIYYGLIFIMLLIGSYAEKNFIYFQF